MRHSQARGANGRDGAARFSVRCPDVLERLYDYLDGELTPAWESHVARHLERCADCSARLRFERSFLQAIRRRTLPPVRDGV